jgi:hypothetical protein
MENTLIKIVIYNYITNYNNDVEYKRVKDIINVYLNKNPNLKLSKNINSYLFIAKKHIAVVQKTIGAINIDIAKYDKLMAEIDNIMNNSRNLNDGSIDDFLQDVMEIKKNSNDLYFVVDKNNKLTEKLNILRENLNLELHMNIKII